MTSIRTFRATDVRSALAMVRDELGDDALILSQREVRRRRFPWSRARVECELTAGVGIDAARFHRTERAPSARTAASAPSRASAPTSTRIPQTPPVPAPAAASLSDPFHLYTHLIEQDVDEDDAREVVARVQATGSRPPDPAIDQRIAATIADMTPCCGRIRVVPGRTRTVALVGPTGVGKTTTLAKLAANLRLRDRVRVGLITVDTYRVSAVDQLKTYAELIDVPMQVVTSPREMTDALDALSSSEVILIDTAGRSPQDEPRIRELRTYLQAARADEVHLVLSLTSGRRSLAAAAEQFRQVGPTAALLTKLDEAPAAGAMLSAARRAALPLSYITTGQEVPHDIEVAAPDWIAASIVRPRRATVSPSPPLATPPRRQTPQWGRGAQRAPG